MFLILARQCGHTAPRRAAWLVIQTAQYVCPKINPIGFYTPFVSERDKLTRSPGRRSLSRGRTLFLQSSSFSVHMEMDFPGALCNVTQSPKTRTARNGCRVPSHQLSLRQKSNQASHNITQASWTLNADSLMSFSRFEILLRFGERPDDPYCSMTQGRSDATV